MNNIEELSTDGSVMTLGLEKPREKESPKPEQCSCMERDTLNSSMPPTYGSQGPRGKLSDSLFLLSYYFFPLAKSSQKLEEKKLCSTWGTKQGGE
jgi:hypothetical protein